MAYKPVIPFALSLSGSPQNPTKNPTKAEGLGAWYHVQTKEVTFDGYIETVVVCATKPSDSSLLGLNAADLRAAIWMGSPVFGFKPISL
jgi:hypothetical protein